MFKYNNILVYINPAQEQQFALQRAIEIVKKNKNANITLFLCCYDLTSAMTSLNSHEERHRIKSSAIFDHQRCLDALADPYQKEGYKITTQVHWDNCPFQVAIQLILQNSYDLLIKPTHSHSKISALLFTPTDWNLLRKCPIPLLLVKAKSWAEEGNILCAIDCKNIQDADHHNLNESILSEAKEIAEAFKSNIHLVNAYPTPPMNIMMELPEFDPIYYDNKLKEFHEKTLNDYAIKCHLDLNNSHLEQGLAEDVIPKVAKDINAKLVILGTVGRSGLGATLLGHTAEQIVDRLDCDLLALKPAGFVSPIKRDE